MGKIKMFSTILSSFQQTRRRKIPRATIDTTPMTPNALSYSAVLKHCFATRKEENVGIFHRNIATAETEQGFVQASKTVLKFINSIKFEN
jgi:hypothetical protein